MKIIGFNGSPRTEGSTAWAINQILEGAKDCDAETRIFNFGALEIKPCKSCWACKNDQLLNGGKGCVIKDDMQKVYDALDAADALVLGSPVYMGQMTAQAKTFTDRLFGSGQYSPRFSPYFKERENARKKMLILLWTQGNPDSEKFKEYFDYTQKMFDVLNFDVKERVVIAGTRNGAASEQKGLDAALKNRGADLVREAENEK